jgi:hypothetical protein
MAHGLETPLYGIFNIISLTPYKIGNVLTAAKFSEVLVNQLHEYRKQI